MVGLGNVDNTSDANKPVSTATQTALDTKAPINNPTFTGTVGGITKAMVGLGNVDNTSDADKPVSAATQTALNAKAPINSPTFTGTVGGITKAMVGLGNVDNTSDADKPVSAATQTALNAKASINSPTFTGTVAGITKTMVGLGNVDNTSDVGKPVSTATQAALDLKENANNKSNSSTLGTSDILYPTQNAVKTYVDAQTTPDASSAVKGKIQLAGDLTGTAATPAIAAAAISSTKLANDAVTTDKIANAAVTDAKIATVSASKVTGNISGNASNVTGIVAVVNGGTGANDAATARTNLGATTVGSNFLTLTNPSAITFPRVNADNTVSTLSAVDFRTAIGAGTSSTSGTVTSVGLSLPSILSVSGSPVTSSGTLSASLANQNANLVFAGPASGSAAAPTFRALVADDVPTLNQNTTGTASNVTGTVAVANGGTGTTTGSITGTGALTFTAGGANQNITLAPTGTGNIILNNNVGIGTTSPASRLNLVGGGIKIHNGFSRSTARPPLNGATIGNYEIRGVGSILGTSQVDGADDGFLRLSAGGGGATNTQSSIDLSGGSDVTDMNVNIVMRTAGAERLRITDNGNVGIGTVSPQAPLHVASSVVQSVGTYGFLAANGNTGISTVAQNITYSIQADARIRATEFNAISDSRIKKNIVKQNTASQLSDLNKLSVVAYNYVDELINGSNSKTGFIAQQVEEVNSNFVNKSADFIPSVFEMAKNIGLEKGILKVTTNKTHGFQQGDLVKLFIEGKKEILVSIDKVISPYDFEVSGWTESPKDLFIYGKKVTDFRAVDFDQITALSVAAIQELSKQIEILKSENAELKKGLISPKEFEKLKIEVDIIKKKLSIR